MQSSPGNRLSLEVAGFVFHFFSEEALWSADPESLMSSFLSDSLRADFSIRFVQEGEPANNLPFERRIRTNTLDCYFSDDFQGGLVRLEVSPAEFREQQGSLLDLVIRIVLISSGKAFPLHACGVRDGTTGFLFTGPPESGKTTMASLWRTRSGIVVLGDERVWLRRLDDGGYWIYGAPLRSKIGTVSCEGAFLEKIFFLHHAQENVATVKGGGDALAALLDQAHLRVFRHLGVELPIMFYTDLIQQVPCYDLGFVPHSQIVEFVRRVH